MDSGPETGEESSFASGSFPVVLHADDVELIHLSVRRILEPMASVLPGVMTISDLEEVLRSSLHIDVLLLDLLFGHVSTLSMIPRYVRMRPDLKVVVLSGLSGPSTCRQCLRAGAVGFVAKPMAVTELREAVARAYGGGRHVSDQVLGLPLSGHRLGTRSMEVLTLLRRGLSHKDIGLLLGLSDKGVQYHVRRIKARLHLRGRRVDWASLSAELLVGELGSD